MIPIEPRPTDAQAPSLRPHGQATAGWLSLGLAFFVAYAFATLVPRGDTWGLHSLAYFPAWTKFAGLALCFAFLWRPVQVRVVAALEPIARPLLADSWLGNGLTVAVAGAAFLAFYAFPMRTEVYGDTRTIVRQWADNGGIASTWLASLLDLRLEHNDAALTEVLLKTVAHTFSLSIPQTFRITSALFGALALGLWTQFVRVAYPPPARRGLRCCSSPGTR